MADEGFICVFDLLACLAGLSSFSFEPESLTKEVSSNEELSVGVGDEDSAGVVTTEEEHHSEVSVFAPLGFLGASLVLSLSDLLVSSGGCPEWRSRLLMRGWVSWSTRLRLSLRRRSGACSGPTISPELYPSPRPTPGL
ncbi:hypothetical protein Nepgr_029527 [Nepenthes gracilis]|uniref:Secreted protein n=1 Tax=Nepenthes gracilis TaxID=150966 RepID=A0AAD3TEB2_NEPGR|nr:hypothetical protein Nepgr_029527 [Nepenthes gracilis]